MIKKSILFLPITLPIIFVLIFFGYFPVNYDIVLQTDAIKGEGICQSYVCPTAGYAAFYTVSFYFGSELKKATIKGYHYDVDQIQLVTSDVSQFDIKELDSYIKGIHLGHFDAEDILPDGEKVEGTKATLSSQNGALHVEVNDPDQGATISIGQPFIPTWFWIVYFAIIILISVLMAILLSLILERVPGLKLVLVNMSCITVALLAGCFFCGSLPYMTYVNFLLNWLFLFAVSLLLNAATLPFLGTLICMAFTTIWYIANYFVINFRSKPIMPADLKALGTAAEVMGGYSLRPSWQMVLGVFIVISYGILLTLVWWRNKPREKLSVKKQVISRAGAVVAGVLLFFIGINTKTFKNLNSFAWDGVLMKSFHQEGMILTYLKSAFNSGVQMPEGYSREIVDGYLAEYITKEEAGPEDKSKAIQPTNIIMVMNEAFSDLRTVGLDQKIDVMPFIDSLKENTAEGSLYVSVFGGGTCNTEFEALTGNSMAFLGAGAYPYTENITDPLFSLASYFQNNGYVTEAFHANEANNWNRSMVYPNLGFEKFNSIDDYTEFGEITYLHEQPADITDYHFIENVDQKYNGTPRFLFNVTMQNHSGYERWLDVEKAGTVAENGSDLYVDTQIYLSLIKASDDEIQQLISTYRDSKEPTMIIFFGDHQPGLPGVAMNEIYGGVESNLDFFKSKFFIWTNYKTEEHHDVAISANYLPWMILDRGNLPLPPYIRMLKEVHEKYPVISSQGVMDSEGNIYTGVAELADDPLIRKYQYIQYANLYDQLDDKWFEAKR